MKFNLPAFLEHTSSHWLRYMTLLITGVLTWNAAWELTSNPIYCIFLVLLAEGATLYWQHAVERVGGVAVEENGKVNVSVVVQFTTGILGIALSWIAIISTDLASLTFIARNSQIDIFSAFQKVPDWAQSVVVYVIPVLAVSHGILATAYHIASPEAAAKRRIRRAHTTARVAEAEAHASEYERLATVKAQEAGRAKAGSKVQKEFAGEERVFTQPPRLKD